VKILIVYLRILQTVTTVSRFGLACLQLKPVAALSMVSIAQPSRDWHGGKGAAGGRRAAGRRGVAIPRPVDRASQYPRPPLRARKIRVARDYGRKNPLMRDSGLRSVLLPSVGLKIFYLIPWK